VSGRMNWDRVNRENRAWREVRRAPSGNWEPDDSWEPYDPPKVDRWPRVTSKRRRPKTESKNPTVPWGIGTSKAGPAASGITRATQRRSDSPTTRHMTGSGPEKLLAVR
jgi:hypothetical protein